MKVNFLDLIPIPSDYNTFVKTCSDDRTLNYTIDTTHMNCKIDVLVTNDCFECNNCYYSSFVKDGSVFQMMYGNGDDIPHCPSNIIDLNEIDVYDCNEDYNLFDVLSDSSSEDSSDDCSDSYDSSDSSDSSDDDDNWRRIPKKVPKKPKVHPKPSPKKLTTESEKRNKIMKLNQEYANNLKAINDNVVKAYKKYKALEKSGQPCENEKNEWMNLNKKYTSMKRRNAREIFDKVQSINRKMNVNSNVYDLHGQGVKCGNLQYILKRIVAKEEKKALEKEDDECNKYVLDVGNENDGDWHKHAKFLVVAFLRTKNMNYTLDDEKRYITVTV